MVRGVSGPPLKRAVYDRKLVRLQRMLGTARPADLMQLLWGLEAAAEGRAGAARRAIPNLPEEALSASASSPYYLAKWELETLASEYLVAPPRLHLSDGRTIQLNCASWSAAAELLNRLKATENAEARVFCTPDNVLQELQRIMQRQLHWQRGYLNKANYYRTARLYYGPSATAHFATTYSLTPGDLSAVGFAYYAMTDDAPAGIPTPDLSGIGISTPARDAALRLVACPYLELRRHQAELRLPSRPIAYQPLSLRRNPLVQLGGVFYAPLRNLLLLRTTSGLYYDLVSVGGSVTREIGANFERYAEDLLRASLEQLDVAREYHYGGKSKGWDTPDLLLRSQGRVQIITECKATKMSFAAQFGEEPLRDAPRGYEELAKGVFQIWRFCSHVRRGLVDETLDAEPAGVLLTLDPWTMLSPGAYDWIFEEAARQADAEGAIDAGDRIPVAICAIEDFEVGLAKAAEAELAPGLRLAGSSEYRGWMLANVLDRNGLISRNGHYPFGDRLHELLPWWGRTQSTAS